MNSCWEYFAPENKYLINSAWINWIKELLFSMFPGRFSVCGKTSRWCTSSELMIYFIEFQTSQKWYDSYHMNGIVNEFEQPFSMIQLVKETFSTVRTRIRISRISLASFQIFIKKVWLILLLDMLELFSWSFWILC